MIEDCLQEGSCERGPTSIAFMRFILHRVPLSLLEGTDTHTGASSLVVWDCAVSITRCLIYRKCLVTGGSSIATGHSVVHGRNV